MSAFSEAVKHEIAGMFVEGQLGEWLFAAGRAKNPKPAERPGLTHTNGARHHIAVVAVKVDFAEAYFLDEARKREPVVFTIPRAGLKKLTDALEAIIQ